MQSAKDFYMTREGVPSDMMRRSLIYTLVHYRLDPKTSGSAALGLRAPDASGAPRDSDLFQEVYTTKNRMVRVFKVLHVDEASRTYCSEHRGFQAWYEGRPLTDAYPPALRSVLAGKRDFEQLEDFNRRGKSGARGSR